MSREETTILQIRLKEAFKRVIGFQRLEYEKPLMKFKIIESQLSALFQIIISWSEYTNFLYKTDKEIEQIKKLSIEGLFKGRDPSVGPFNEEEKKSLKEKFGEEAYTYIEQYMKPDPKFKHVPPQNNEDHEMFDKDGNIKQSNMENLKQQESEDIEKENNEGK